MTNVNLWGNEQTRIQFGVWWRAAARLGLGFGEHGVAQRERGATAGGRIGWGARRSGTRSEGRTSRFRAHVHVCRLVISAVFP